MPSQEFKSAREACRKHVLDMITDKMDGLVGYIANCEATAWNAWEVMKSEIGAEMVRNSPATSVPLSYSPSIGLRHEIEGLGFGELLDSADHVRSWLGRPTRDPEETYTRMVTREFAALLKTDTPREGFRVEYAPYREPTDRGTSRYAAGLMFYKDDAFLSYARLGTATRNASWIKDWCDRSIKEAGSLPSSLLVEGLEGLTEQTLAMNQAMPFYFGGVKLMDDWQKDIISESQYYDSMGALTKNMEQAVPILAAFEVDSALEDYFSKPGGCRETKSPSPASMLTPRDTAQQVVFPKEPKKTAPNPRNDSKIASLAAEKRSGTIISASSIGLGNRG